MREFLIKAIVYVIGYILIIGLALAGMLLSQSINKDRRAECEAQGGHYLESRYNSHKSLCDYGRN